MARVRLPAVLRPLAEGAKTIDVIAPTYGALRVGIVARYPALADRLYDVDGRLKEFVSVFVEGEDARELADDAPLATGSEVVLLPAVSGG
jgi:molybdopterin synthase sulfur carrier subunit